MIFDYDYYIYVYYEKFLIFNLILVGLDIGNNMFDLFCKRKEKNIDFLYIFVF